MRFIYGFICALVVLTIGAFVHDHIGSGATKLLVNWDNVGDLLQAAFDAVRDQINSWIK